MTSPDSGNKNHSPPTTPRGGCTPLGWEPRHPFYSLVQEWYIFGANGPRMRFQFWTLHAYYSTLRHHIRTN